MTRVLVFGVFDHLHPGHRWFLRQAKHYGDHLTVILARSKTSKALKGRAPCQSWRARRKLLLAHPSVDRVAQGDQRAGEWTILERLLPATIVTGYDQHALRRSLRQKFCTLLKGSLHIITLGAHNPTKWKSSLIHRNPYVQHCFSPRPSRDR